jgi:hypothetical protein
MKTSAPPMSCVPVKISLNKKYAQTAVKAGLRVAIKFEVVGDR